MYTYRYITKDCTLTKETLLYLYNHRPNIAQFFSFRGVINSLFFKHHHWIKMLRQRYRKFPYKSFGHCFNEKGLVSSLQQRNHCVSNYPSIHSYLTYISSIIVKYFDKELYVAPMTLEITSAPSFNKTRHWQLFIYSFFLLFLFLIFFIYLFILFYFFFLREFLTYLMFVKRPVFVHIIYYYSHF